MTRERITKEIWNDYGNADEGLTQSVSYLRKLLNDEAKELIKTIPKKGYVLHAVISPEPNEKTPTKKIFIIKQKLYLAVCITVLIVAVCGYLFIKNHNSVAAVPPADVIGAHRSKDSIKTGNPDLIKTDQKTGSADAMFDTTLNNGQH